MQSEETLMKDYTFKFQIYLYLTEDKNSEKVKLSDHQSSNIVKKHEKFDGIFFEDCSSLAGRYKIVHSLWESTPYEIIIQQLAPIITDIPNDPSYIHIPRALLVRK